MRRGRTRKDSQYDTHVVDSQPLTRVTNLNHEPNNSTKHPKYTLHIHQASKLEHHPTKPVHAACDVAPWPEEGILKNGLVRRPGPRLLVDVTYTVDVGKRFISSR